MDPVTATGLVLGVIPLIISALENYDHVCQMFYTFRDNVKEANRFSARLSMQRTVFYNQCQLLLSAISPGQKLEHVLGDQNHPDRDDNDLNQRLERLLGSSLETCIASLRLIHGILQELQQKTKDFHEIGKEATSFRRRLLVFRQRVKLTFSKERLEAVVNELRQHNSDLKTLTSQIQELGVQRQAPKPTSFASQDIISHFRTTRQALRKVHALLAGKWACEDEVHHEANLSLLVAGAEGCQELSSVVRFHLVLICRPASSAGSSPILLDIESSPVESQNSNTHNSKALMNVRAALEDLTVQPSQPLSKPPQSPIQVITPLPNGRHGANSIPQTPNTFVNLSDLTKLCRYFHNQLVYSDYTAHMAFLEEATTFNHFVYLQPSPRPQFPTKTSLKEILQSMSAVRKRGELSAKLRLARLLSLGILRFTSTPWLEETWSSSDILFFDSGEKEEDVLSKIPSFTASLYQQKPLGFETIKDHSSEILIPNRILYNLGVVLLELGYDAPLKILQCDDDLRDGELMEFTMLRTAKRLGRAAPFELGSRYGKIVQRCLRCDFGVGESLDSVELQNAVVRSVIEELELCIKAQTEVDAILSPAS